MISMTVESLPKYKKGMKITNIVTDLIIFITLPIIGILYLGWKWQEIFLLYWLNNITIGAVNVVKMVRTNNTETSTRSNGYSTSLSPIFKKVIMIFYFCLAYGVFTFCHGIVVWLIINSPVFSGEDIVLNFWPQISLWIVSFIVQIIAAFFTLSPSESISKLLTAPYKRLIMLHVTIMLGIWAILFLSPNGVLGTAGVNIGWFLIVIYSIAEIYYISRQERANVVENVISKNAREKLV